MVFKQLKLLLIKVLRSFSLLVQGRAICKQPVAVYSEQPDGALANQKKRPFFQGIFVQKVNKTIRFS